MDVEQLRLPSNKSLKLRSRARKPFLKGPIPLKWIQCAAKLPGKALHVGLVIWFLAGVKRSITLQFSYKKAKEFGIKRHSAYRGLQALEKAGLIRMEKGPGRTPRIYLEEGLSREER